MYTKYKLQLKEFPEAALIIQAADKEHALQRALKDYKLDHTAILKIEPIINDYKHRK